MSNYTENFHKEPNYYKNCEKENINKEDPINPDYYKIGGIQPYEYLKMKLTHDQYSGWLLADCIVYLSRFNYKHEKSERIKDLEKARWFLDKLIESEKQETKDVI